jgi:hypothetical protein
VPVNEASGCRGKGEVTGEEIGRVVVLLAWEWTCRGFVADQGSSLPLRKGKRG